MSAYGKLMNVFFNAWTITKSMHKSFTKNLYQ